jgi:hypothetical protein
MTLVGLSILHHLVNVSLDTFIQVRRQKSVKRQVAMFMKGFDLVGS